MILEDSCKFSVKDTYNDQRWTVILKDPTDEEVSKACKDFHFEFLLDFYTDREKIFDLPHYGASEVGIGIDKKDLIKKLYYNISGHIYGVGVKDGKLAFKHYRCMENYPKPQISKLIGEKDTIFEIISDYKLEYKNFFHNRPWNCFEERGSYTVKSLFSTDPDSYHASLQSVDFKIQENAELIKKILQLRNCNIENIDKWISKNDSCAIKLIGLSKNDVTFYYNRKNK